jgi:predicted DNA binding protein
MAIVAEFSIPPDAVPGGSTLETLPGVRIELERIVPAGNAVLPYFWAFGADADELLDKMQDEPDIEELKILARRDESALFEAEWRPTGEILEGIKHLKATIMEAEGTSESWVFQVRAPDRDRLSEFQQIFTDQGISVELNRIYNLAEVAETKRPITDGQQEMLLAAYKAGYYDDQRRVSQRDLAETFDISPRAVSKRLRRGTRNLISATLVANNSIDET